MFPDDDGPVDEQHIEAVAEAVDLDMANVLLRCCARPARARRATAEELADADEWRKVEDRSRSCR